MSPAYLDTGLLVKLYSAEANSAQAAALVSAYATPLPLTLWQELELRTALRCRTFRKEMTAQALRKSLAEFEGDIAVGRWERPTYDVRDVHREAESLSDKYAVVVGCRTLDLLHVAAALIIAAKDFVTFDGRQGALASRAGLKVKP